MNGAGQQGALTPLLKPLLVLLDSMLVTITKWYCRDRATLI